LRPLGCDVIGPEDLKVLAWARAEIGRREAARKAKAAWDAL
jgi:hypothetical protein